MPKRIIKNNKCKNSKTQMIPESMILLVSIVHGKRKVTRKNNTANLKSKVFRTSKYNPKFKGIPMRSVRKENQSTVGIIETPEEQMINHLGLDTYGSNFLLKNL